MPPSSLPRRRLAALLTAGVLGTLGAGCSRETTTNRAVPLDPLARHAHLYDVSTAEALAALPLQEDPDASEMWPDLDTNADADHVRAARGELADFLEICFLSPTELSGLEGEALKDRIMPLAPQMWKDNVAELFTGDLRHLNISVFEPSLTVIGTPLFAADWFTAVVDDEPAIRLGGTVATAVLNPATNATGICAHRIGAVVRYDGDGALTRGDLLTTINGVDLCASEQSGGLIQPIMSDTPDRVETRTALMRDIVSSPRIGLRQLIEEDPVIFKGYAAPNMESC